MTGAEQTARLIDPELPSNTLIQNRGGWRGRLGNADRAPANLLVLINHFKGLQTRAGEPGYTCRQGRACVERYQARISGPLHPLSALQDRN